MRKVITILTFACIIFASCGDSKTTSKEQELELKEQELKAKEESLLDDKKKEIELKEQELKQKEEALKSTTTSIKRTQSKVSRPTSNYVIGIKERIYFYESPDYGTQTSVYFVKGQKAKVVEIMDENLDNEFLHVNFEYKGKVTDGYILYEDVKFE
jgi:site-specific DNA-cytosine methylase